MNPNNSSNQPPSFSTGTDSRHPFLHELHCIGSLPSVLKRFESITGWRLMYYCADSIPESLRPAQGENLEVSVANELPESLELTPQFLSEISRDDDCWLPVEIRTEFQNLIHHTSSDSFTACNQSGPLKFLEKPIGFLHLFAPPKSDCILSGFSLVPYSEARHLAVAIRDMIVEMQIMRVHIWLLETNEAANTVILEKNAVIQNERFAGRLRQALEFACNSLNLAAIGVYLFDGKRQQFKLRASVGLPMDSLLHPARKFANAQADLRAFSKNDVVVYDSSWRAAERSQMPETFESGICMPLKTDRSKLGSIWFFLNQEEVPESIILQTQLVAELIAVSIEREAFLRRYSRAIEYRSELKKVSDLQMIQNPVSVLGNRNFELKGWVYSSRTVRNPFKDVRKTENTLNEETVCGDFYDWFTLPNGQTLVTLGSVGIRGLAGAILAASVRATIRSHAQYQRSVSEILACVHKTLWQQSAVDGQISLFCGVVNQEGPFQAVHFGNVGTLRALKSGNGTFKPVRMWTGESFTYLGGTSDFHCYVDSVYLKQGESLTVFNDGLEYELEPQASNYRVVWERNSNVRNHPNPGMKTGRTRETHCNRSCTRKTSNFGDSFSSETVLGETALQETALQEMDRKLEAFVFDTPTVPQELKASHLQKLEMQQRIIDTELGKSFCEKQNPSARLLALMVKSYLEKHVTRSRSDQSALVIQHLLQKRELK